MRFGFSPCLLGLVLTFAPASLAQSPAAPPADVKPVFTANYPANRAGVFIQDPDWKELPSSMPAKTKAKHAIAASLSYGAVPATVVAEYDGVHSSTEVKSAQPVICLCHLISLPGTPVIVRLHPKKNTRELDGGKMIVYPVVGGSKMADAKQSDLVPVDVSHPESQVWLVRPQTELDAGEYALMLGTQNVNIFPFTFLGTATTSSDKR